MALLAAIGAIATFNSQNEEIARLRKREVEVDKLAASERSQLFARQQLADERAEAQQFETTFFGLLKAFRDLVISLDLIDESNKDYKAEGHDVFRDMLALFKGNHFIADSNAVGVVSLQWPLFANHFKNDLNHYFRTLYHIVCFVERARVENKYFYIQILRSFLSEAELSLLALNCECGEGRQKFKVLVEKFALLHNLSEDEIKFLEAKAKIFYLRVSAFGRNG